MLVIAVAQDDPPPPPPPLPSDDDEDGPEVDPPSGDADVQEQAPEPAQPPEPQAPKVPEVPQPAKVATPPKPQPPVPPKKAVAAQAKVPSQTQEDPVVAKRRAATEMARAVQRGDHEYVFAKVAAGEHSLGVKDHTGNNEIHHICMGGGADGGQSKVQLMQLLIQRGVPLDQIDGNGRQALFSCASNGQWALVPFFKGQPYNILNSVSKHGQPGLHMAVKSGLHQTVKAMLDIGADPHAKATPGGSPYLKAKNAGDAAMKALFNIPVNSEL